MGPLILAGADGRGRPGGGLERAKLCLRRSQCINNLKQIGLGVANYESGVGCIPPSHNAGTFNSATAYSNDFGMKVHLLPFIEMGTIYNAYNQSFDYNLPMNFTATVTTVKTYLCPSDATIVNRAYTQVPTNEAGDFGDCNYGNNIGTSLSFTGMIDGPAYVMGQSNVGANATYGSNNGPAVTYAAITDGLSNTAMHSEWQMGKNITGDGLWQVYAVSTTLSPRPPRRAVSSAGGPSCRRSARALARRAPPPAASPPRDTHGPTAGAASAAATATSILRIRKLASTPTKPRAIPTA